MCELWVNEGELASIGQRPRSAYGARRRHVVALSFSPVGSRNKASPAIDVLLGGEAATLTRKAIRLIFEITPTSGSRARLSVGEQGPCYSRTTCQVASSARGVPCQLYFGHRARSDDAHLAPEDVEELGYFIKTCFAEH